MAEHRPAERPRSGRQARRSEAKQVDVPGWPVRLVEPQVEEERPLQQELIGPGRHAQTVQQPLERIPRQDQVEVRPVGTCAV